MRTGKQRTPPLVVHVDAGKLVTVHFDGSGRITGANTRNYLLERPRVAAVPAGERNYHIFYQLLTDASIRSEWGLEVAERLVYLSSEPPLVEVEEEERD